MNRTTRIAALALAIAPALAFGQAATWNVDPAHTRVGFSVKHLVISDVKGEFSKVSGKAQLDESDLSKSSVEMTIEVASVDTRDEKRDAHLKSADFFDAAKFPTITFKSTKVVAGKDGAVTVTGDLTMRGVTKPVTLEGTISKSIVDPWGLTRRGVSFTGKLDRKEWGVSWSKVTDVGAVVGDEVKLDIQAEITKDAAEEVATAAAPSAPRPPGAARRAAGRTRRRARGMLRSAAACVSSTRRSMGRASGCWRRGRLRSPTPSWWRSSSGTGSARLSARAAALALVERASLPELAWASPEELRAGPAWGRREPRRSPPPSSWAGAGPGRRPGEASGSWSPRGWPS